MEWQRWSKALTEFLSRYRDVPVFLRAVRLRFYDALFGASVTGALMTPLMALFHMSWFWLSLIFVGGIVTAAYGTWREEYIKSAQPSVRSEITEIHFVRALHDMSVYLSITLRNSGPSTSLDRWRVEYELNDGQRHVLNQKWQFDQGRDGPTDGDTNNLILNEEILASGGIRLGWLAFKISVSEAGLFTKERKSLEVGYRDTSDREYHMVV